MATVLPFQRYVFGPGDVDALQAALAGFSFPGGWRGWEAELAGNGECKEMEVVNPNDWEPLTLLRSRDGAYVARDADDCVIAQAGSFSALLAALDISPS